MAQQCKLSKNRTLMFSPLLGFGCAVAVDGLDVEEVRLQVILALELSATQCAPGCCQVVVG